MKKDPYRNRPFIDICREIGKGVEGNARYTDLLCRMVGDDWSEMSLMDVLQTIEESKREFNRLEKIARGEA